MLVVLFFLMSMRVANVVLEGHMAKKPSKKTAVKVVKKPKTKKKAA